PPIGAQQNVGSLPMNMALSPNGKFAVTTDMGFRQSLWSIRTSDGTGASHLQFSNQAPSGPANGLYYGLAFAPDGTLYAAQGANDSIIVVRVGDDGTLTQIRSISTRSHDFPSGLALDGRGFLYAANNDPGTFNVPGSVAIYNAATGAELGRYAFADSFFG